MTPHERWIANGYCPRINRSKAWCSNRVGHEPDLHWALGEFTPGVVTITRWRDRDCLPEVDRVSACVFCERIESEDYDPESRDVVSFIPLNPVTRGHRLFVPALHVEDALEKPWVSAQAMEVAASYARIRNQACNLITSVGSAATQTIMHLHVHYVPRREGDGLHLPWTGQT